MSESTHQHIARELLGAVEANRVSCTRYVIIETGVHFVQMLFNWDAIYGEVVSNTYLTGDDRLVPAQEARLLNLGWLPPDMLCHSQCCLAHPNFHRVWSQQTASQDIVTDLLTGLMVVASGTGEGIPPFRMISGPRARQPSSGLPTHH